MDFSHFFKALRYLSCAQGQRAKGRIPERRSPAIRAKSQVGGNPENPGFYPTLITPHDTTMSFAMICHCNNKIKYNTNTSRGKPGFKSYMHCHQQMMRLYSALRVLLEFRPFAIILTQDSAYIHREAAVGDQTHAASHRATGSRAVRRNYPVSLLERNAF